MPIFFARGWILISSWASLVGWLLALSAHLNKPSYGASLVPLGLLLFILLKKARGDKSKIRFAPLRYIRQLRKSPIRPLSCSPVLFMIVAILTLLGGLFYAPSNYDALSYRFPRILHWLDAQRWHWIDTPNTRQNYSAAGFEWLMTPLFVFFETDRLFFLVNWISFLFLPSLFFRTFRLAGVSTKTCWLWMWLLPLGYGYVLQAGSIGNDAFATNYALTSVCFVLSANRNERFSDLGWAMLAAALLTGTKGSNLPLALPWLVAMILRYQLWIASMPKLIPWLAMALMISFGPTAALNHKYSGSWSGDPANEGKMNLASPSAGLLGNSLMLGYTNLQPPLLLSPSNINRFATRLIPSEIRGWLRDRFPRFELRMGEIPMEESAGLGLPILVCLALWILKASRTPTPFPTLHTESWFFVGLAGIGSLLFYMSKMGSESAGRLVLPYYPFLLLLPLGLWRLRGAAVRKLAPLFTLLCSTVFIGLFLNPARPYFRVHKLLILIGDKPQFARVQAVYNAYLQRDKCWDPILPLLPTNIKILGFFSHGDDLEAPLWKPWGCRKVISASEKNLPTQNYPFAEAWLARRPIAESLNSNPEWRLHWEEAGVRSIAQKASLGPEEWVLFLSR